MFCKYCGTENADNATFCTNCGAQLSNSVSDAAAAPATEKLGWAKFLGYFALWLGALLNLSNAVSLITGSNYGELKETVYAVFPAIKPVDMIYGLACVAFAVLAVVAAICIIQRRKLTLTLIPTLYISVGVVGILYLIATSAIISQSTFDAQAGGNIVMNIVMFFVNRTYFKNRTHIFVK